MVVSLRSCIGTVGGSVSVTLPAISVHGMVVSLNRSCLCTGSVHLFGSLPALCIEGVASLNRSCFGKVSVCVFGSLPALCSEGVASLNRSCLGTVSVCVFGSLPAL